MTPDDITKAVAEALPCDATRESCMVIGRHGLGCPARNRPAVEFLVRRMVGEVEAHITELGRERDDAFVEHVRNLISERDAAQARVKELERECRPVRGWGCALCDQTTRSLRKPDGNHWPRYVETGPPCPGAWVPLVADLATMALEVEAREATLWAVVQTIGGIVEGHPTSRVNLLQRLRELVKIEAGVVKMREDNIVWKNNPLREKLDQTELEAQAESQATGAPGELVAAVKFLGRIGEVFINAGMSGGDREVVLSNAQTLVVQRDAAQAECAAMRGALLRLEWSHHEDRTDGEGVYAWCPVCRRQDPARPRRPVSNFIGHSDSCWLAAALSRGGRRARP